MNGLHVEGTTQLIAHIKFAGMQMALYADVKVLPKTGDRQTDGQRERERNERGERERERERERDRVGGERG